MKRPIELQPSGNPGTQRTDQCRFYDMILIKEIISIRLIFGSIYFATFSFSSLTMSVKVTPLSFFNTLDT